MRGRHSRHVQAWPQQLAEGRAAMALWRRRRGLGPRGPCRPASMSPSLFPLSGKLCSTCAWMGAAWPLSWPSLPVTWESLWLAARCKLRLGLTTPALGMLEADSGGQFGGARMLLGAPCAPRLAPALGAGPVNSGLSRGCPTPSRPRGPARRRPSRRLTTSSKLSGHASSRTLARRRVTVRCAALMPRMASRSCAYAMRQRRSLRASAIEALPASASWAHLAAMRALGQPRAVSGASCCPASGQRCGWLHAACGTPPSLPPPLPLSLLMPQGMRCRCRSRPRGSRAERPRVPWRRCVAPEARAGRQGLVPQPTALLAPRCKQLTPAAAADDSVVAPCSSHGLDPGPAAVSATLQVGEPGSSVPCVLLLGLSW